MLTYGQEQQRTGRHKGSVSRVGNRRDGAWDGVHKAGLSLLWAPARPGVTRWGRGCRRRAGDAHSSRAVRHCMRGTATHEWAPPCTARTASMGGPPSPCSTPTRWCRCRHHHHRRRCYCHSARLLPLLPLLPAAAAAAAPSRSRRCTCSRSGTPQWRPAGCSPGAEGPARCVFDSVVACLCAHVRMCGKYTGKYTGRGSDTVRASSPPHWQLPSPISCSPARSFALCSV